MLTLANAKNVFVLFRGHQLTKHLYYQTFCSFYLLSTILSPRACLTMQGDLFLGHSTYLIELH